MSQGPADAEVWKMTGRGRQLQLPRQRRREEDSELAEAETL